MSKINTGGPTFPVYRPEVPEGTTYAKSMVVCDGMTLRDHFAVKALPLVWADNCVAIPLWQRAESNDWMDGVANDAYSMADAMLKAREA
jgi:hypothetical protein